MGIHVYTVCNAMFTVTQFEVQSLAMNIVPRKNTQNHALSGQIKIWWVHTKAHYAESVGYFVQGSLS